MSTTGPDHDDLVAMVDEASAEIAAAELLRQAIDPSGGSGEPTESLATLEFGYYEAELRSLRGAAATLDLGLASGASQPRAPRPGDLPGQR